MDTEKKTKIVYKAKGEVMGFLWGGGKGGYPTIPLEGSTEKEILQKAEKGLDGSLDSGMGFERLTGAILSIRKVTRKTIKGKEFVNDEFLGFKYVGKLSETDNGILEEWYFNRM